MDNYEWKNIKNKINKKHYNYQQLKENEFKNVIKLMVFNNIKNINDEKSICNYFKNINDEKVAK